jgi:7,8-dihydroneopterin aldolase/epimerase/oxygenase
MTTKNPSDEIFIEGLEIQCRVGVPDQELASPQRLRVDVSIRPRAAFESLGDDIAATIDYAAVCTRLAEVAAARPRRLIESLAADLAAIILGEFGALEASVTVRKFILEHTESVGVRCTRPRPENN